MKGYFKQLATQTGLNFSSGAVSPSAAPVTPLPLRSSSAATPAAPEPIAVETVSFTSQPSDAGANSARSDSTVDSLRSQTSFSPSSDSAAVSQRSGDETEERWSSRDSIVEIKPVTLVSDAQTSRDRSEPRRIDSERASFTTQDTKQALLNAETESDVINLRDPSENQLASGLESSSRDASQRPALSDDHQAVDDLVVWKEDRTEPGDQARSSDEENNLRNEEVGSYLKEVMEWIAARPDTSDEDATSVITDAYAAGAKSTGIELNNETLSASQLNQTREPEIQDTSISIGTISIVVEDPSGLESLPPAMPVAPVQTQSAPPSSASPEPTNLSRYYLRSW